MIKATYLLLAVAIFNAACVYSQFNYDDYDDGFNFGNGNGNFNGNGNGNQNQPNTPRPTPGPTTTTVASRQFTECFNSCRQRTTPQYNPVCGSNGQSYTNMKMLECAQQCGLRITFESIGTCGPSAGGK